jgi:hypothetical protein
VGYEYVWKIVKQKCSECGKEYNVTLGCVTIYEDEIGVFHSIGAKCECGYILNSERLKNAKK